MRRYERPHINEVWCGDSSVGPRLTDSDGKKHRIYIIALIDDASRFITGIDVFYNDNFINLMSVMKSAVSKYGRPKVLNFDNGKSYKNKQMELLAARIGTTLSYCQPYTPNFKSQNRALVPYIKRPVDGWPLICGISARWMNCGEACMLLCRATTWSPHSSLRGHVPTGSLLFGAGSDPQAFCRIDITQNFLLEIERRVSADSVIVIDQIEYEVDCRFARQRIRLR